MSVCWAVVVVVVVGGSDCSGVVVVVGGSDCSGVVVVVDPTHSIIKPRDQSWLDIKGIFWLLEICPHAGCITPSAQFGLLLFPEDV
jgi:hypothetical protein